MRKLFKERKLFKGGNYMRKYGNQLFLLFVVHKNSLCSVLIDKKDFSLVSSMSSLHLRRGFS